MSTAQFAHKSVELVCRSADPPVVVHKAPLAAFSLDAAEVDMEEVEEPRQGDGVNLQVRYGEIQKTKRRALS